MSFCAVFFLLALCLSSLGRIQAWQQTPPAGLLITEFYYNPPGLDEEREWVEMGNLSGQTVQLNGYGLGDEEQIGQGEGMLRFPEGSEIGAGEAIVVAQTAIGFRALFGSNPDFELQDSDTAVPDMLVDSHWASGQFALANDGDEIILVDAQNNFLDALNYGDRVTFFTPNIPEVVSGQSIERVPAICDTDSAADWRPQTIPTPGELIMEGECASAPEQDVEDPYRAIGEIQGAGDISPLLNQVVTFRGLVTGMLEDQNASGVIYYTLFVQDMPGFEDGDPATSDAVAVFLGRQRPLYQIGDQVKVTGQVTEYFGLTEIDDNGLLIEKESPMSARPNAVPVELPRDAEPAFDYLEAHEGMLVSTEGMLPVVGPTHPGCGFAVGSTPDAIRPIRHSFPEINSPPILVLNQSDVDCSALPALKSMDLVAGISGPLTYHFEQYKVVQQDAASLQVERGEPVGIPEPLHASRDWIRVATLNLDNYLNPALDPEDGRLSGRVSGEDLEIKRRKLAYTIGETLGCPELLGVQEVETEALLLELVNLTASACGYTYQVTHRESADGRGIDVALISDPRRVIVTGVELRQTCSPLATGVHDSDVQCAPGEEPLFSRPPLEVALQVDREPLIVFVNHFKSKRGGELETAPRRLEQSRHVHGLVKNRLAKDPQAGIIVLGDFNDYDLSPVWQQLQEGGVLYDPMQNVPPQERYSYIFDGESQLIDGILISPSLVHRVVNASIFHVNADYPVSFALEDSPERLPYHTSDHDPVILTLHTSSHSDINKNATATITNPKERPTASKEPTTQPQIATQITPTIQPVEADQPEDGDGSRRYFVIVGFMLLLVTTAVLWLVGSTHGRKRRNRVN